MKISGKPSNPIPRPDFADLDIIKEWIDREEISGVIITGEGRHFSAGADLEYFKTCRQDPQKAMQDFAKGKEILDYIESLEKPVLASIDGICFGGGLEIALACHMRFCSKSAVFCFPEINHGIIPGLSGIDRLVRLIGKSNALYTLMTGDTFNADDAFRMGMVNRVVPEKTAFQYALDEMNKIISKGEKTIRYAIRSVNNSTAMDKSTAIEEETRMFMELVIDHYVG